MNQAWAHFRSSWLAGLVGMAALGLAAQAEAQASDLPELPALPEAPLDDASSAPPPDQRGPRPPSYMVEEPLPPPYEAPPRHSPYPPGYSYYPYEPPPPPAPPPHIAPRSSFLLGSRFGFLSPFGRLTYDYPDGFSGPAWGEIASSGFSFELNAGGRFGRHFLAFALWEHGALGIGADRGGVEQTSAATHLFGAGFRFSSHPDEVGLAVEAALGFRTFRADFANDMVVTATSPEVRIGIGADIRLSRSVTLSPMMQISNGSFLDLRVEQPGLPSRSIFGYEAPHGTFGFALGAHFDLFPSAH